MDVSLDGANPADYLMLLLCCESDQQLRTIDKAVQFVTSFFDAASLLPICHGSWTLIEVVEGRTLTSWPSSKQIFKMQELTGLIKKLL